MGRGIVQFDLIEFEVIFLVPCPSLTGQYLKIYSVKPGFCWERAVTFLPSVANESKLCALRAQAFVFLDPGSTEVVVEPHPCSCCGRTPRPGGSCRACPPSPAQCVLKDIVKDTDGEPGDEVHRARARRVPGTAASVRVGLPCTACLHVVHLPPARKPPV